MARFKPGQEVVCVGTNWRKEETFLFFFKRIIGIPYGPQPDEIVTVDYYNGPDYIALKEYSKLFNGRRYAYQENLFEPIISSEEIEELMKEVNEPQKA